MLSQSTHTYKLRSTLANNEYKGNHSNLEESRKDMLPIRPKDHGSEMATVIVGRGDQAQTFTIHKHLLCQASSYFYGALQGKFRESRKATLKLEGDCPMVFEVLYHWLYSGSVLQANYYT